MDHNSENKAVTTVCRNCGESFTGNYCYNCGQKADTPNIDIKFLIHKIRTVLFKRFDKGIIYTSKQLFTRPGDAVREYIQGKRVKHYDPVSFVMALAAFYALAYHNFNINIFTDITSDDGVLKNIDFAKMNEWVSNHFSLATFAQLPFYTIGSYISFRRQGYNFTEHLTLNTFLAGQRLLLRIATFPLLIIFNGTGSIHVFTNFLILLDFLLMTWSYCQFFNEVPTVKAILLSILSYVIFLLTFTLVLAVVLLIIYRA